MSYLFIATHLGAGGTVLLNSMRKNDRVRTFGFSGFIYHSPPDLLSLKTYLTKNWKPKPGTIYADKLVYNTQLTSKQLYDNAEWVYLIREPEGTLEHLVSKHNYTPECAEKYYSFRLRRLCEMARHTPKALVLYFDDLVSTSALPCLERYLKLKEELPVPFVGDIYHDEADIPHETYMKAKSSWKRYTKYLRTHLENYRVVLH